MGNVPGWQSKDLLSDGMVVTPRIKLSRCPLFIEARSSLRASMASVYNRTERVGVGRWYLADRERAPFREVVVRESEYVG